jgi:serine/threonine protein kinase
MRADTGAEEQFGPYLVYERLGVGGMATVHRALERGIEGFERIVALKRLLPHLAADASFIKAFVREAKLASLLNHVNIVQIFECGRVGAQYFISMEHIDGKDIRRILRHARRATGPPPIHVTVGLLLQLCDALDYAHCKTDDSGPLGLVHRDVSPSNVLVTSAGQVKVIDFGIAKAQTAQLRTQSGRVKGKLAYMAPEALVGKELDARSDLFAAGIIGHELLTARPLFATRNDYQTLSKIQRGEIMPPSTFNQSCPPELDAIVLRALARDPDERFLHAADLRDELHAMRKQYGLQTGERDIAAWLDWAFGPDAHSGRPGHPRAPSKTEVDVQPLPAERPSLRRSDEDEAIEIAWGQGDGDPVVLDDVPDVADKQLSMESSLGAEVRLDLDDLADVPTPIPGVRPSDTAQRAMAAALLANPPRIKRPTPALPVRTPGAAVPGIPRDVATAQAAEPERPTVRALPDMIAAPTASAAARSATPQRPRTTTMPPRVMPAATAQRAIPAPVPAPTATAQRAIPAAVPAPVSPRRGLPAIPTPPRGIPTGSITPSNKRIDTSEPACAGGANQAGDASRARDGDIALGSTRGARRARSGTSPGTGSSGPRRIDIPSTAPTMLFVGESSVTDPTAFSIEDLGLAADTIPTIPALQSEPVVRFRESTTPPPVPPPPTPPDGEASLLPTGDAAAGNPRDSFATALFADPDTVLDGLEPVLSGSVATTERDVPPMASATTRRRSRSRSSPRRGIWRMAVTLVALAVAGAAITAGALTLIRGRRAVVEFAPPPPLPAMPSFGTLQFVVVPTDVAITIGGKPVHAGTPWEVDLEPGTHQIEIRRDGYKAVLTQIELSAGDVRPLEFTLEPIGATLTDATLSISTSPPGLEVVVDGASAGRTNMTLAVPPGSHTIVVRRNGADVWRKTITAQANTIHELRPTIASPAAATSPSADPAPR